MNQGASNFVEGVDSAFYLIIGISLFFLVAITFTMIYFVIKYNRKKHPKAVDVKESKKLEVIWIVIPTFLVLLMFYYGWVGFRPMRSIPEDAYWVKATGRMWSWSFEYPNGKVSPELYVPKGKPVALKLYSPDVMHSLYIPAFRIKEDVTPGVNNKMWFTANLLGEYDILCAEYCGDRHSYLLSKVKVLEPNEFEEWVNSKNTGGAKMAKGEELMAQNGCFACHSRDGSKVVGPSFKGLYGSKRSVFNEKNELNEITADDNYIKESIYEPNAEVVQGFTKGVMQSYKETISEDDLKQMIEFLKTLK